MILIYLASCKKFVEVDMPPNQLFSENVFNDKTSANAAFSGIYSELSTITHPLNADIQIAASMYSGILEYTKSEQSYLDFGNKAIQINNSIVGSMWTATYQTIYQVNLAIQKLQASSLELSLKNQLLGEAKFIRAFCYFYFVSLYGGVPLITENAYENNAGEARAIPAAIHEQILADLTDAIELLADIRGEGEKIRPDYFSACALLSKVYLSVGNWQKAFDFASLVIDQGEYELEQDLRNVFAKESKETIWQLKPSFPFYNTNIGRILTPSLTNNTIPNFCLSDQYIRSFLPEDKRFKEWIGNKTVEERSFAFPYKYKVQSGGNLTEYQVIFRLAEIYLIRSEAAVNLGNFEEALQDINKIRDRADLPPVVNEISKTHLIDILTTEVRHELFTEWANEWLVEKRLNDTSIKLWPIPLAQLELNPNLEQNNGY
jgi:hypothetical protein